MVLSDWKQKIGSKETGFFHHAFIIEGEKEDLRKEVRDFLREEFDIAVSGNPDYVELDYISFKVDDAASLKERHSTRASNEGAMRISVVSANTLNPESQNKLLKLFEEPSADTVLFIITPSASFLLPTLLSRTVFVASEDFSEFGEVPAFLKKDIGGRVAMAVLLSKDASKDDDTIDHSRGQKFLDDLVRYYHHKGLKGKRTKAETRVLSLALKYREYAHNNSPSYKMMLGHLALIAQK
jgi:DNA polymerase III delta prime subunit